MSRADDMARAMLQRGAQAVRAGMKPAAVAAELMAALPDTARFDDRQQAVEDLGDTSIRQGGNPIPPERIRSVIRQATSPDDLIERLAELFDAYPPAEYRAVMERALFAADVMGYAHEAQRTGIAAGRG